MASHRTLAGPARCRRVSAGLHRAEGTLHDESPATTFLFTDVEGSTRLWEEQPDRMRPALARHDAIARSAVEEHGGQVVKMTGDGLHAAFEDPLDALVATLELQLGLVNDGGLAIPLQVRCGLHAGPSESRDRDFYGTVVNRAARIMSAAHGGQVLLSRAVAERVRGRLPDGVSLSLGMPVSYWTSEISVTRPSR